MKISDTGRVGSEVDRLLAFLEKQPDDEIFSTNELREQLQLSLDGGSFWARRAQWRDYTHKMTVDGRYQPMWGNKTAIESLRKREEESHGEN